MPAPRFHLGLVAALSAMFGSGCQTQDTVYPAVLHSTDEASMAKLRAALAEAMGRARVEIGPGDLTQSSTVSVLPPPLGPNETHSTATPTQFDIVMRGDACFLQRRDTEQIYPLDTQLCRRAPPDARLDK